MQIKGPIYNDYLKSDNFTEATTNWSLCGTSGEIIITIEITVDAQDPNGNSQVTVRYSISALVLRLRS